jgi:hypothetical protein
MWPDSNYKGTLVAIKHPSVDAPALSKRLNCLCQVLWLRDGMTKEPSRQSQPPDKGRLRAISDPGS